MRRTPEQHIDTPSLPDTRRGYFSGGFFKGVLLASSVAVALASAGSSESADGFNAPIFDPKINGFESPYSPCTPEQAIVSDTTEKIKEAKDCLAIYATTKVALVNYSLDDTNATFLGRETQAMFNDSTEGIVNAQVTVINASPAAKELLKKENPNNCINNDRLESYASYIAAVTMPSLHAFDKIIGVGPDPSCVPEGGESFQGAYNRYSDIFNVPGESLGVNAVDAAHELGHLYGLGHSGILNNNASENLNGFIETLHDTGGTIDLDHYTAHGKYYEYAGNDIMGSETKSRFTGLNIPEQYLLEWPNNVLNNIIPLTVSNLDTEKVIYNDKTSPRSIALLDLSKPVHMPGKTNQGDYDGQEFNTIAFVPKIYNGIIEGVEVYMVGNQDGVVDLGPLHAKDKTTIDTFNVSISEENVTVTADPTSGTITLHKN